MRAEPKVLIGSIRIGFLDTVCRGSFAVVTARVRWWMSDRPVGPLTEIRKALVERYMIDADEAEARALKESMKAMYWAARLPQAGDLRPRRPAQSVGPAAL